MGLGPNTYDLNAVMLTIQGVVVDGFADGDVISFTHPEDLAAPPVGSDGHTVISRLGNNNMEVEIRLMLTSKAYTTLYGLLTTQHPPGLHIGFLPCILLCIDMINGETIVSGQAVFMTRPEVTYGKTVGERSFKLYLPNAGAAMIPNANL